MNRQSISKLNNQSNRVTIVLDDDPTGCQTIHGLDIFFQWDSARLKAAIQKGKDFFLLTNSRALPEEASQKLHENLLLEIKRISQSLNTPVHIISRSDSTLRGHYYAEIMAIEKITGPYDGIVFCPYFKEGNRFTKNNIHYVVQGEQWTPAHETEFAKDEAFGYSTAYLPDWIAEKSHQAVSSSDVVCITMNDIREGGVAAVYQKLIQAKNLTPYVINALDDTDLEVVVLALLKAESEGKRFIDRSAASWVKVRLGIEDKPVFSLKAGKAGIIVAGSYVSKTTRQLENLIKKTDIIPVEADVNEIVNGNGQSYFNQVMAIINDLLKANQSLVLFTSREYAATHEAKSSLERGRMIMDFLCKLINTLEVQPGYIISKGGITSNEIARRGAEIKSGNVLGQVHPGVPAIQASGDSKFPGMPYVIFPGNVGHDNSLLEVYTSIQ